jgi:MFS family permease
MISIPATDIPYPTRRDARYVAFIVFAATLFSFLDRQILTILVDPIRRDLHVSDTQMSLLYGFAFVILYSTIGLPIGRLIDRHQRRLILAAGVAVWSVMTIACGLAHGYGTLFCARIGVGIGEACLTPAACSLLADCFEPRVRGRAMSFYLLGVYSGIGLSLVAGGMLYDVLLRAPGLPIIGQIAPWRAIFIIVGCPGLLIAALVLTMKEPSRQDRAPAATPLAQEGGDIALITHLRANAAPIAAALIAQGVAAFVSYSLMGWAPSVLIRQFHESRSSVGLTLGLLSLAGGAGGALAGAVFCDRWTAAGIRAAKFRVCAVGTAFCAIGLVLLSLAEVSWAAFAAVAVCLTALPFAAASGQAIVQELFPNRLRGQGSAMTVLLIGLFGAGCGPLTVGLISDHLFHGQGLSRAMVWTGTPAAAVVIMLYLCSRNRYEELRRRLLVGARLPAFDGSPILESRAARASSAPPTRVGTGS